MTTTRPDAGILRQIADTLREESGSIRACGDALVLEDLADQLEAEAVETAEPFRVPHSERMRAASGEVDDLSPLVCMLYLLARDELPVGAIETRIRESLDVADRGPIEFTNGWLAVWARDAAERLFDADWKLASQLVLQQARPFIISRGAELISAERIRQITDEGYDAAHDAAHLSGDFVAAARCYGLHGWWLIEGDRCGWSAEMVNDMVLNDDEDGLSPGPHWPWNERDWKPADDPIRDLVRAGALIAAEIDRADPSAVYGDIASLGERARTGRRSDVPPGPETEVVGP